jgi:hypothetical protein
MRQAKLIGLCVLVLVLVTFSAVPVTAFIQPKYMDPYSNPRVYDRRVEAPRMQRLLAYYESLPHLTEQEWGRLHDHFDVVVARFVEAG